jgi:hypothetical protein
MKDGEFKRLLASKSTEYFFKPELTDIDDKLRRAEDYFMERE